MSDNPSNATRSMSLAEALPEEQRRVRGLISLYEVIGPTGAFAIHMMNSALTNAEKAAAAGDVVGMLRAYEELKGFQA